MSWDTIVIGSGFGGAMAAHALVSAGERVLMLERGDWVERTNGKAPMPAGLASSAYDTSAPYAVTSGRRRLTVGAWHCVGGQSVFYGGASFRFREADFDHAPEIVGDSGAEWPFGYDDLEPYYSEAERLLQVAGDPTTDPIAPWRSANYPKPLAPLAPSAAIIARAAQSLGMHPVRIPLAISFDKAEDRDACLRCGTCDCFACAVSAKNDMSVGMIPSLLRRGMELRTNAVVVRLERSGSRITAVHVVDRVTRVASRLTADRVVLAAGALATPHLLLASGLESANPAGHAIGRYLTRHCNAVVFALYLRPPNAKLEFEKQIAIHDFYFGDTSRGAPSGKLGVLQQLTPAPELVKSYVPGLIREPAAAVMARASGMLAIAEDQPQFSNGVTLDPVARDSFGLPRLHVVNRYTARDIAAVTTLARHAKRILRATGTPTMWTNKIETFSHALGTVRMGVNEATSPLDGDGRFRGLDNLYVADGSTLPRSAGVNPSLTIAANALRVGTRMAGGDLFSPVRRRALPMAYDAGEPDSAAATSNA